MSSPPRPFAFPIMANEGSSSNPNRPTAEESPRRRNTSRGRGRASLPRPTTELALFTPPRAPSPPPGGASGSGGQAVPVGGGGGAVVRVGVGGNPLGRKRGREGVGAAAADEGGRNYNCSVCNKAFSSARAVFGHMRKHPDRGWTGAHPPPAFRAEEEFADLPVAEAIDAQPPDQEEEEEEANYRVPDLNNPPPPDSN